MNTTSSLPGKGEYRLSKSMGIWLFLASLLLNCFLLGLLVAPVFRPHMPPPPFMHPQHMMERMTSGLSASDTAIVQGLFQKQEPAFSESHMAMDKAMLKMSLVLQQPTVNEDELHKAMNDIAAAHAQFGAAMDSLITQAAASLSVEGRQHFATSILPPPHEHEGGMHPPPQPHAPDMDQPAPPSP